MNEIKHNPISNKAVSIIITVIIILQTFFVLFIGSKKKEFHIDETYSYILANSHDADRLSKSNILWQNWISPDQWDRFTTVQSNEKFDWTVVYKNNSTDAHPPLFYWCLNALCSFFPNSFSMWYGISINITFFVLSLIVLFLISKKLIKNVYLSLLPVILWGFSPLAADSTVFIRMYSLLTLITLLSALIHINLYTDGHTNMRLVLNFIITFLGAMTQYYFIVISFCISSVYCIYLLYKKEYKSFFIYGLLQITAIILLFIVYPASITQVTGSPTNNIGNEVAATFFSLYGWPKTIIKYIIYSIYDWSRGLIRIKYITFIAAASIICTLLISCIRNKKTYTKQADKKSIIESVVFLMIPLLYVIIISKLSYRFVYVRYLYHIIPLVFVALIVFAENILIRFNSKVIFSILLTVSMLNATSTMIFNINSYLFSETYSRYKALDDKYGDIPIVLMCDRNTYVMTSNYMFLKNYSDVYITSDKDISNLDKILSQKNITNGFLMLVWSDEDWSSGYNHKKVIESAKNQNTSFDTSKHLYKLNFCDIYYMN